MTDEMKHSIECNDEFKKMAERVAALLELESWYFAISVAMAMALKFAEAYVKGDTELVFCTRKVARLIEENPKFIKALCEEGVVEWLTPFVLTKTSQEAQP